MFPRGLLQEYAHALSIVARLIDIFCILLGAFVAYYIKFESFSVPSQYQIAILIGVLLAVIVFSSSGIYSSWRGKRWLHQARIVTMTWLVVVVALIILAFMTKSSTEFSRQWMAMWTGLAWVFLLGFRLLFFRALHYMREKGWNHKRILIVGTGELASSVVNNIRASAWTGLDIVGLVDETGTFESDQVEGIDVIRGITQLPALISRSNINEVWMALPLREEEKMRNILDALKHSTVNIRFVPGIFGFRLFNHAITEVAGLPVIDLNSSPIVGINGFIKMMEDKILASAILLIVSPALIMIAIGVKFTSNGSIIFKQVRQGWDGKPIKVYKFRTMVVHKECEEELTQACKYDTRVTPFGAFLRRTSLDELPQFFNVLQGRMSIVGPRPHVLAHNELYKEQIEAYMLRHKVKPGITGWAQINGWRGQTDTFEKMKKRIEFDLYYIENWSLWLDIKIIFFSLFSGFVHKNAY
jgi:putative colanic acid biosysnthesis UDP-glucose lipid carrier transferase